MKSSVVRQVPFIDLAAQYEAYREEIDEAMSRVVQSARFVLGPEVEALEEELADYVGTGHCVTCASGTDALYIALRALRIGPGDEVIVPGFSFFATAGAVTLVGATPVFCDIDPDTYTLDPSRIAERITQRTRAIIPVGLFGQPADMDAIWEIAEQHGFAVIEDAAQSFGAFYRGRRSCGLGTVGCTSFYPAKPLGSFGEGGALFTDDEALARTLRRIMNQGQSETYRHAMVGINGRLHALQAAVLRVKLSHLDDELAARERVASEYRRELSEIADCGNIVLPLVREDRTSVYAQYTVRVSERDAFRGALHAWGIPTAIHYPLPMYRQEAYAVLGQTYIEDTARRCPNCESSAAHVVSLPFGPFLQTADQQRVSEAIGEYERRRI